MANHHFTFDDTRNEMIRRKTLWDLGVHYGTLSKPLREAFFKGEFIHPTSIPLVISEQNTTPARPVHNTGTKFGTRFDRLSKDPYKLEIYTTNPHKERAIEIWALEKTRVPKYKGNRMRHPSICECWICALAFLKARVNLPPTLRI